MTLRRTYSKTQLADPYLRKLLITRAEADLTSRHGRGLAGMALHERSSITSDARREGHRRNARGHASRRLHRTLLRAGKSDFEAVCGVTENACVAAPLRPDESPSEGVLFRGTTAISAQTTTNASRSVVYLSRGDALAFLACPSSPAASATHAPLLQ
jgi:hypothetical protein